MVAPDLSWLHARLARPVTESVPGHPASHLGFMWVGAATTATGPSPVRVLPGRASPLPNTATASLTYCIDPLRTPTVPLYRTGEAQLMKMHESIELISAQHAALHAGMFQLHAHVVAGEGPRPTSHPLGDVLSSLRARALGLQGGRGPQLPCMLTPADGDL